MKAKFEDILPLVKVEENIIINKYGDVAFCFAYTGKEMFSQDKSQLGDLNDYLDTSFNFLDESFVIHKQEVVLETTYNAPAPEFPTYMSVAQQKHFSGKKYFKTFSYLYVIRTDVISLHRDYNTTRQPGRKGKKVSFSIEETLNAVTQFCTHLERGGLKVIPLSQEQTEELIEGYFSFFETGLLTDITFSPEFRIGDNHGAIYALNTDENQPDSVSPFARNEDFSTEGNAVYSDYLYSIGIGLQANHVLNQFFFLDGQKFWLEKLEARAKSLESMRMLSTGNAKKADDTKKFLDGTVDSDGTKKVVRMHMNIMFWADTIDKLRELKGVVKSRFIGLGIRVHQANYLDLKTIYLSGCPGNAGTMPYEETFVTHSALASCYFIKESVIDLSIGKPSTHGLQFVDRVANIPMFRDSWHKPYDTKQIENRNFLVVGKSGGGKSSTMIEIVRQYLEMGFNVTVIDIGRSFELLVKEYNGNDIIYQSGMSLGVNPFEVADGVLTVDRLEYLATFVFILWKPKEILEDEKRSALEKTLLKYYDAELRGKDYTVGIDGAAADITGFYNWVQENETIVKEIARGREDFFDYSSFLLTLDQFVNGKFASLFVTKGVDFNKLIDPKKSLTVWELDNVKDHPTLFPIFSMLITYMSQEVLWKNVNQPKIFLYDEGWKILEKAGMGIQIKYQYKTARKFDAGVGMNIQTLGDLNVPHSNIEETVLGNSDIKLFMKHSKDLVPALKEKLQLSDHHESLLLSIKNNLKGKYAYTEHLNMVGADVKIVRTMVSPQQRVLLMSERKDKDEFYRIVKEQGDWYKGIEIFIRKMGWL